MQNKFLPYLVMVGKISIFSLVLVAFLSNTILADNANAQGIKSVKEAKIKIALKDASLEEAFKAIQENSEYVIFYVKDELDRSVRLNVELKTRTVEELLLAIAKQANVSFRQVNERISVKKEDGKSSANSVQVVITQGPTVTGKVIDENDEPLPGATVLEKGTSNGTITDVDGKFSLSVSEGATLVVTFVGYTPQEATVDSQTNLIIQMTPDFTSLAEVVVVGYGEQTKETMTGSVSNIKGEDVVTSPSANVTSSLAGRLPGLAVSQRTGEPGRDDPNILIRGTGSFVEGANNPLIIVDGVPRSLMSRLNPEDIESISVLKDASAAIYGARAANGVILITTKQGSTGKPVFNFSYNHAFQQPTKLPEMLDAATFAQVYNEGAWYRAGRPDLANWTPPFSDDAIERYANGSDPVRYPNTDWIEEVLKPFSTQRRINLSANGGTENTRYFLSFGATTQDGSFKNDPTEYNQYNMRVKVDVDLTENLTVGANLSAILNDKTYGAVATDDDVWVNFHNIIQANPTLVARYPNGLIGPGRLGENPLLLNQRGYISRDDAPIYSTFTASYDVPFVEGLKLEGSYNYDLSHQHEKRWRLPYYYYEYNTVTEEYDRIQGTGSASAELWDTYRKWTTKLYNLRVNYSRTFDEHHVGVLLGTEQQENRHSWVQAYRRNFVSTAIDQINVGSSDPDDKNNGGSAEIGGYNNYFGRINYDFDGKYLVEFVFRYDGSQRFPKSGRYGFFPGVSAGWRLSEESFLRGVNFINQLKIRGSYGQIGNDAVPAYQYLQAFTFGNNYPFGGSDAPGIDPGVLPNPNITWETSEKLDVGIEGTLWGGLLGFEYVWWNENRSDILAPRNVSVSNVFGFPGLPDENIGEVRNRGFELVLSHRNTIGQLQYQISANTAFARSEIRFMDEVPQDEAYKNQTGHPVGAALYYKADGIFQNEEELNAYPHLDNTQVGDIRIVDLNNDGEINGADQFRFDYTATPEYTFGLNFSGQYKNFDLSVLLQGQTNAYNYDDRFAILGNASYDNATVERAKDRWTVDNSDGTMPRADGSAPGNNTMWVFDATFVRLKTLELGYSVPQDLVSKVWLKNTRFYISGFNLFTWAKEIKWADPEANGGFLYYPQLRVINLGVNVKF